MKRWFVVGIRCSTFILTCSFMWLEMFCAAPQAFAAEQTPAQHHSLIYRQQTDSKLVEPKTAPPIATAPSASTPRSSRKLTKRPAQAVVTQPSTGSTSTTAPALQSPSLPTRSETRLSTGALAPVQQAPAPLTSSTVTGPSVPLSPVALSTARPAPVSALANPGTGSTVSGGPSAPGGRGLQSLVGDLPGLSQLVAPTLTVTAPTSSNPTSSNPTSTNSTSSNQTSPSPAPSSPAPGTGSAILTWTLNSEGDLAGYKIYVGTSPGRYTYPGSPIVISPASTYLITGLPASQTYYFAISAFNSSGAESALSSEVSKSIY